MRIAICSDEPYPIHDELIALVEERGHEVMLFGALKLGNETPWASTAEQAALAVVRGEADEGIFCCWTGTGISMAANKVPGIRAALCRDSEIAEGARIWNHANVLCLSNARLTQPDLRTILDAWFETDPGTRGSEGVDDLLRVESRHRT